MPTKTRPTTTPIIKGFFIMFNRMVLTLFFLGGLVTTVAPCASTAVLATQSALVLVASPASSAVSSPVVKMERAITAKILNTGI